MSTIRNKIKSEALSQARQTRAKKRQADAKKYNRKTNKTDEAVINGNIRQASALRAYGIKKNRAQGNKIYGFDEKDLYNSRSTQLTVGREKNKDKAEYLFTNKRSVVPAGVREDGSTYDSFITKKRRLSDTEKENFAKYGDTYDKDADKKKYKLFNSANKDADSYLEHFNTGQWDGLKTAKARIKDQDKKGISKLVEYGIGLGKDILADPVVDAMRVADAVGGAMTGAGLGALENVENALKGHKMEEGLIRKNFKDSLNTSNKTGWSKGSSEFLTEKDIRQFEKDREYFKNDAMLEKIYGTSDLEEFKEKAQKGNNWAGLIWDIIGDPTSLAVNFGKNATKATVKAGKEMLDGTADISTAIKSKHLDDIFFSSKPYEDLKLYDDSGANKIHNQLDNGYNRAVSNDVKVKVKEKVSTSPQTPFLASYLDELDNGKPLTGKQLKMDGRTLNKKYTQTKTPIEPYKVPELDPTIKGAKVDKGYQLSMFDTVEGNLGKDISANKVGQNMTPNYNNYNFPSENFNTDYVRKPDPELKTGRYKYENGVQNNINYDNELYDKVSEYERLIDESDDKVADLIYDYLEENEPEVYARLMDGSDLVDEIVGAGKKQQLINDNYTKQFKEIEKKAKKEKKFDLAKEEKLKEENAIEKLANIFERKNTKPTNAVTSKYEFSDNIKNLTDKIVRSSEQSDEIKSIIKKLKGDSISNQTKREQINNLLFGGREIITNRVSSKAMDELLTSFDEIIEVKKAKDWYNETGEIINVKLSESTRKMLGVAKNKKIDIESIDVEKLAQTLNNKSRGYTDTRYPEKLELLANVYEYKSKEQVQKRIDDIPKELKKLDKMPLSQETINAKTELSKELKTLKKKLEDRDLHWKQIRNLSEADFDKYISENYPQFMKNMQPYKHQTNKYREIKNMDNTDGFDEAYRETSEYLARNPVDKKYENSYKSFARDTEEYDRMLREEKVLEIEALKGIKPVHLNKKKLQVNPNIEQSMKYLRSNKEVSKAFDYVKELLKRTVDFEVPDEMYIGGKNPFHKDGKKYVIREVNRIIKELRNAGVKDEAWFEQAKAFKAEAYKMRIDKINNAKTNPLKQLHANVNRKYHNGMDLDEMSELQRLNEEYERILNSTNIDELLEGYNTKTYDNYVTSAGDNMGSEIGSMLRVNNTPKETPLTKLRPQSKLPDPKYKLTKDKDLINLETGETKPFFDRHTTQEEYNEKIHGGFKQKNIEEYERLQKYVDNPDKYGIYDVMNLMDSMNIKFDPNDAESMDKALNKFFWIIEKKGIVPSNMKNTPQPNKSVKDMRNLPTNELKQLSDETKGLVNNPMSLVENRALQDRNRDEIIDNARKMYEREDKESLFDRLFQQADTKEKMKGVKPLFEQVDEYANSSEGLKQYYTNLAKNDEVIKQLELANKGINPNVKPNKSVFDKLNKNQYSKQVNKDIDKLTKDRAELKNIDKLIGERITPQMVEEVGNKISKSLDDIKIDGDPITPEIRSEMTKEIHKYIDETLSRYSREEQEAIYEGLFQKLETIETNKNRKTIYEEVDDYLNSLEGLNKYYSNQETNSNVIKRLNLANKGIDVNKATTNKTILDKMAKQMNKHQFDPKTKRNYEEVVRQAIERGEIDEKIAERLTPEMLEKVMNSDKSIFDIKFKSDKQIKAENQANMTRELHKRADDYVAKQDKDTFGIRKKPKKVKQTEDIKPKTKEELLNDELSIDSIGKDIEKDIKQHQKENKPVSFEKFKSWLNNDEAMFYEDTKLYNAYKSWLNSYKKGLTVYNPGWHVQNYFQNKGQNYLALGMDAFKPQTNAKQIIKEIKGKPNKAKNVGKYTPQQIAKMAKDMNIVEGLGADVQQTRGIFPDLENKIDNTPMMKKLMENEKTARLHHFITQIENGMTPEKAMKSVNDTLFDYSKANKVDKVISDFIDPFWTFHKNNATLMGKSAFSPNSGRLNKVRKFHENLDDTQEKEVKQNYGRLYGNKSFVDDVNGDTYNFLYKEGMMPDIANALPLSQEEVENKLNPILRLLAQQSRGEGNFGNKLVEGNEAGWGETTKSERIGEVISELNPFLPNLFKTLSKNEQNQKKSDDGKQSQSTTDKQILSDWINYITGFKGNYYREIK